MIWFAVASIVVKKKSCGDWFLAAKSVAHDHGMLEIKIFCYLKINSRHEMNFTYQDQSGKCICDFKPLVASYFKHGSGSLFGGHLGFLKILRDLAKLNAGGVVQINTVVADDLATQGARTSAAMVLTSGYQFH